MKHVLANLAGPILAALVSAGCAAEPAPPAKAPPVAAAGAPSPESQPQTPAPQEPTMQTTTDHKAAPSTLPSAAAVITHEVTDYATWKRAFDAHADTRKRAGIFSTHINRSADNPNLVSIYLAAGDLAGLRAFLGSEDLKATMTRAGVKGPPTVALITPVEDATVKDKPLPGAIVIHKVAVYETWKKAFDGDASARAAAGIIGHAVNRSVDDPNVVIVYIQSTTLDQVKGFAASPALKETMIKAGVQGAPKISFVQGAPFDS